MTETIKRVRGWSQPAHNTDEKPTAICPLCGEDDTLTRESYWHREARCSSCGYHGRVVWNRDGGPSAYVVSPMVNEDHPDDAREHYGVASVVNGRRWEVAGWRPEVTLGESNLPAYVLDAVHREWAKDKLREDLPAGSTVYTVLHHVSRSGMVRHIGVRAIADGAPVFLDGLVAIALDEKQADRGGIIMGGCGMDMGFSLVYNLSSALFPDGHNCLGEKCPSNDHSNDYNGFSHAYDAEHAPEGSPWWLTDDRMIGSGDYPLTDEEHERRGAYRKDKRAAWEASQADRYAPTRRHSDGGYALRHRWL